MLLTQMEGPEILTQKIHTLDLETVPTELRCQDCQHIMRLRREDHASETDSATAARIRNMTAWKQTAGDRTPRRALWGHLIPGQTDPPSGVSLKTWWCQNSAVTDVHNAG